MNNTTTFTGITKTFSTGDFFQKVSLFNLAMNKFVMSNMVQNVIEVEASSKNEARILIRQIARSQQSQVTLTSGLGSLGDATCVIDRIIQS